jgi:hypothetical protein
LQEADDRELLSIPEDVTGLLEEQPVAEPLPEPDSYASDKKSRRGLLIGGGIAAVAGTIGLVLGLAGGDDKPARDSSAVEASGDTTTESTLATPTTLTPPETTPSTVDIATNPETMGNLGNLNLLRLLPGEEYVTLHRNDKDFRIPKLRSPETDANLFAESALNLMACYLTSGNEDCLGALTQNEDFKASLLEIRQKDILPYQSDPNKAMAQVAFADRKSDPVTFKLSPDKTSVILEGGRLEFGLIDYDPDWQSLVYMTDKLDKYFTNMTFTIKYVQDSAGKYHLTVSGMSWDSVPIQ